MLDALAADDWWRRALVFHFGDGPDNAVPLLRMAETLRDMRGNQMFDAAVTIGLALQACYLIETDQRLGLYRRVISALAQSHDAFLSPGAVGRPLMDFLGYYLYGRDAVALSVLPEIYDRVIEPDSALPPEAEERRLFWALVGLVESGAMERAYELAPNFKADDKRLLLALHLGCYFTEQLRITSARDKKLARQISDRLGGDISALREQLLKELRTELLEIRRGKVNAIEAGAESPKRPSG
jgi:hypothetical protein